MTDYKPRTDEMNQYKIIMCGYIPDVCDKDVCQFCGENDHKTRASKKCAAHFNYNVGKILELKSEVDSYKRDKEEFYDREIQRLVETVGDVPQRPAHVEMQLAQGGYEPARYCVRGSRGRTLPAWYCFNLVREEIHKMKRRIIELENNNKELEEKNKK